MDFGLVVYRRSWPGLGRGSWLDSVGGGGQGFVDPGGRGRRLGVRGFVGWGSGFVDGFVGSGIGSRAFGFVW